MPEPDIDKLKRQMRAAMRERRRGLGSREVQVATLGACKVLRAFPALKNARLVAGTFPHAQEISIVPWLDELLSSGKRLALPRVSGDGRDLHLIEITSLEPLRPGYRGIAEPPDDPARRIGPAELDALLVPGLAFDARGARLGRGGGHYDRLLQDVHPNAVVIGLCYAWQIVDRVPECDGDARVHWLVSPDGAVQCSESTGGD